MWKNMLRSPKAGGGEFSVEGVALEWRESPITPVQLLEMSILYRNCANLANKNKNLNPVYFFPMLYCLDY